MSSARTSEATKKTPPGNAVPLLTDAARLIEGVETFLFDLDACLEEALMVNLVCIGQSVPHTLSYVEEYCAGVIWKGGKLLDGVSETLQYLRTLGKKLFFITNNSTTSRKQLYQRFAKFGLTVEEEEIFSSSFAAAAYLTSIAFPTNKKVYVVGEGGIREELDEAGIQSLGGPEDGEKQIDVRASKELDYDPNVGAVVVGFDRHINYYKLVYATLCLRGNPGCLFIATNLDSVSNVNETQEWPAGGCMVGAVKASTFLEPTVVGKPSTFMMDYLADKFQIGKAQMCMVGDRLDTDILFGQRAGCKTLLVLSGVTTLESLCSPENNILPDFYTNQLSDLLSAKNV